MPGACHDASAWKGGHCHGGIMSGLPAAFTPNPVGGQPTPLSTRGGFPPRKANEYVHPRTHSAFAPPPPPRKDSAPRDQQP